MVKSETRFSNENANDERFGDDVLDQGTRNESTSGIPRSNMATEPSERRVDQFEESEDLFRTALMDCYNG
jgi:hypothetical protein